MELASTTLWVADTLATLGRADDARALLGEARRELERFGYRHELERADAVAARLE